MAKEKSELLTSLGMAVRKERQRLGISQEELAGRAGLNRTYITDVERGARNLSLNTLEKLASALNTTVLQLLTNAGDPPESSATTDSQLETS